MQVSVARLLPPEPSCSHATIDRAARCLLDEQQLARLESVLEAGPLAAGFDDQRWTLARIRDLVARRFGVQYTIPGVW